jgi:hypothetical protein
LFVVNLNWPEEEPLSGAAPGNRHPSRRLPEIISDPLMGPGGTSLEVFAADGGFARHWPLLIVIAVLLVVGGALFVLGPLPTIFPTMSCNGCWVPHG